MRPACRTGRTRRVRMPAASSAGVRSGASAAAMPNSSNQVRGAAGEPRVRIDRVRTASIVSPRLSSWAQKASSVNSASSSVAGAASTRDTSSTSSCRSSRTAVVLLVPAGSQPCGVVIQLYENTVRVLDICPWPRRGGVHSVRVFPSRPGGPSVLMQKTLLAASRRPGLRRAVTGNPATRKVVNRFVAGEGLDDALAAVRSLAADGIQVTLDHLGEDITTRAEAEHSRDAYLALLHGLAALDLGAGAEVSVKLSAFGQSLPDGEELSLELVRPVVEAATAIGTTVTLDMEDHRTVDATLGTLAELRKEHPGTGAVLQAMLFRTEADAKDLAVTGSRVRLVKGAYNEPASVAHQKKADVDAAYARCLEILMAGPGYPMVGSHDPAMVQRAHELAAQHSRAADSWEIQMLYGIRPDEQRRLAAAGTQVRAYVPYGVDWYAYFMRRLAERPANIGFFLRSLATRS